MCGGPTGPLLHSKSDSLWAGDSRVLVCTREFCWQDQFALDLHIQNLRPTRGVSEPLKLLPLKDHDNHREQRFPLRLPVHFGRIDDGQNLCGVSENISVHGISLKTDTYIPPG